MLKWNFAGIIKNVRAFQFFILLPDKIPVVQNA
jgi:hypothetical protein